MFQDFVKEQNALSQNEYMEIIDTGYKEKCSFYRALMRSGKVEQTVIVDWACQHFNMKHMEEPFHQRIDLHLTATLYPAAAVDGSSSDHVIERRCDIKRTIAEKQCFLSNGSEDGAIFLLHDPENDSIKNRVSSLANPVCYVLATDSEFGVFCEYQLKPKVFSMTSRAIVRQSTNDSQTVLSEVDKMLNQLLETALDWRATDLRILPLGATAEVSMTIDGKNVFYTAIDAEYLPKLRRSIKHRCGVGESGKEIMPVEAKMRMRYKDEDLDIRVNIISATNGFDFNLRFIRKILMGIDDLGLSVENRQKYERILHLTKGLVIISGPTGSGKTSLLYAGFRVALKEGAKIFSIEEPVEINLPGITQVEVDVAQGLTKQVHFNSALRHRPNIASYGEIRDREDAMPAINFAHTGHPTHATIHANDALGVIARMINMGIEPYVLGDTLAAIIAQRLVRRVCPYCAESYFLESDHKWRKLFKLGDGEIELKRGRGCEDCAGVGYRGQMAINEIILTTPAIRNAIQMRLPRSEIQEILDKEGFQNYLQDGIVKALAGETTFDELEDIATDLL